MTSTMPGTSPFDDDAHGPHIPDYEATERLLLLLRFLTVNSCTRQEIFDHLGLYYRLDESDESSMATSRQLAGRTLERDLAFFQQLGFIVTKTPDPYDQRLLHYHVAPGTGPYPQFLFDDREVDALITLYNLFADPSRSTTSLPTHPLPAQSPRHPFAEQVLSFAERLVAFLPEQQYDHFVRFTKQPFIYFNMTPVINYLPHRDTINSLLQAIASERAVRFLYYPSRQQTLPIPHERIDPYYVTHLDGHFYLIGYDHKIGKFGEYRIDRIVQESLMPRTDPIDRTRRQHPITFWYWADADLAQGGLSQRWLSQTIEREEDYVDTFTASTRKRVLVRATAYNAWRIIQQMHKYAHKVELVDPPFLREWMRREVERIYHFYHK